MKRLVQFALEAGGTVVVEVDEPGDGGLQRAGRAGEISETAAETLEAALDRIRPAAEAVVSRLRNLSQPADEVGVEFGIKLNAKIGAKMITKSGSTNWKRPEG